MNTIQAAQMRVSDADRDTVVATLSEAYQAGRLTAGELDDRTGRALAARTAGELAPLTADLPGPVPVASRQRPPDGPEGAWLGRRGNVLVLAGLALALAAAVLAVLGALGETGHGHRGADLWWLVPVAVLAARRLARGPRGAGGDQASRPGRHF